jgi:hypothetical protein
MVLEMSDKTEAEKWAEFDAMRARRVAFEQRPWRATDYVLAFLYNAVVFGIGWGVVAVAAFLIFYVWTFG